MNETAIQIRAFLLLGLLLLAQNVFPQDHNFYIFLCFGQSNMEGQGSIGHRDRTVDDRFLVMQALDCPNLDRTKGNWYTATPPLTRCNTGLSPSDYFGRAMVQNLPSDIRVGIINVSVAGCKIELFDKDSYLDYAETVESWMTNIINTYDGNPYQYLVDLAILAQEDGVIKGILLHQGESNTGDNQWPAKVKTVYDNLMADLNLNPDSVPLLAGEVVHADQGGVCASMNSIIAKLPETIPNSYVISSSGCLAASDDLHFNSAGYRTLGSRYARRMLSLLGYDTFNYAQESFYYEAECATFGENWRVRLADEASNNAYITVETDSEGPTNDVNTISINFTVSFDTTYYLYGRINSATASHSSFWLRVNEGDYLLVDDLSTTTWEWVELNSYDLTPGSHTLTIGSGVNGPSLDKINITNHRITPADMGLTPERNCIPDTTTAPTVGVAQIGEARGFALEQNYPNPFRERTTIAFQIPYRTHVSIPVYSIVGSKIAELAGSEFDAGHHTVEFSQRGIPNGTYFYSINADRYSAVKRMVLVAE